MKYGMLRVVQQSLLGPVLSNMLFVLGCAFLCGGIVHSNKVFNKQERDEFQKMVIGSQQVRTQQIHEMKKKEKEYIKLQNWSKTSLMSQLSELNGRRKLDNLTIGPTLQNYNCYSEKALQCVGLIMSLK